jgi:hypothetical protein
MARNKPGIQLMTLKKEFTTHQSKENWESILSSHDVNSKFNTFLNIFRTF